MTTVGWASHRSFESGDEVLDLVEPAPERQEHLDVGLLTHAMNHARTKLTQSTRLPDEHPTRWGLTAEHRPATFA
jgi:hypothetical protein